MQILFTTMNLTESKEDKKFLFKLENSAANRSFKQAVDVMVSIVNVIKFETKDHKGEKQQLLALIDKGGQVYIGTSRTVERDIMKAIEELGNPSEEDPLDIIIRWNARETKPFSYVEFV